ncbi:MAG: aminoglycoside adenylyltransferase domain-containing protein [Anaerolineales bacterium]|jgi:hypothetical protein
MSNQVSSPTPYPGVNAVLDVLLPEVQAILGTQFIGLYLYGSLAYGGFDQDSDVDFVVVTRTELPESLFSRLQAMHSRIAMLNSWCATQLEGSYVPLNALQKYDPMHVLYLHIDRGLDEQLQRMKIEDARLSHAWWGGWVFLRAVLWENGIKLAGPDPKSFIVPVSQNELKQAALATLQGWGEPLLEEPAELLNPGYQSYCVLTLCRILYTLEFGAITSKQAAACWAQEKLDKRWGTLIQRAWAGRHNPQGKVLPEAIKETQDLIRFILEHSQKP